MGVVQVGQELAVLIVEDQAFIAADLEEVARELGATLVGSAAHLATALALLETAHWDAVMLDLHLANGVLAYPLAERLRNRRIPFAFLTAADNEIEPAYRSVRVLRKPFGEAELEECLRALIAQVPQPAVAQQAA